VINSLFTVVLGLLGVGFALVSGAFWALYKSTPPTMQGAFLETFKGIIATLSNEAEKRALDAKNTPSDLDDRLWEMIIEAIEAYNGDLTAKAKPLTDETERDTL